MRGPLLAGGLVVAAAIAALASSPRPVPAPPTPAGSGAMAASRPSSVRSAAPPPALPGPPLSPLEVRTCAETMAYVDYAAGRAVMVARVDGAGTPVKITNAEGSRLTFSPDGAQVAYLADDKAANCQHIDVVAADGSTAATPMRVHDCAKAKDFITQLAWIRR